MTFLKVPAAHAVQDTLPVPVYPLSQEQAAGELLPVPVVLACVAHGVQSPSASDVLYVSLGQRVHSTAPVPWYPRPHRHASGEMLPSPVVLECAAQAMQLPLSGIGLYVSNAHMEHMPLRPAKPETQ